MKNVNIEMLNFRAFSLYFDDIWITNTYVWMMARNKSTIISHTHTNKLILDKYRFICCRQIQTREWDKAAEPPLRTHLWYQSYVILQINNNTSSSSIYHRSDPVHRKHIQHKHQTPHREQFSTTENCIKYVALISVFLADLL